MTNVGTRELRGRPRPEDQSWLVITRPNYYFLILSPAAPVTRGVVPSPGYWRIGGLLEIVFKVIRDSARSVKFLTATITSIK